MKASRFGSRYFGIAIITLTVITCKPAGGSKSSVKDDAPAIDYDQVKNSIIDFFFKFADAAMVCKSVAEFKTPELQCLAAIETSTCKGILKATSTIAKDEVDTIKLLNDDDLSQVGASEGDPSALNNNYTEPNPELEAQQAAQQKKLEEKIGQDLQKVGIETLRDAVSSCIKAAEKDAIEKLARNLAAAAGVDLLKASAKAPINIKNAILGWACTGGAQAIGNALSTTLVTDTKNSCGALFGKGSDQYKQSRAGACFRSAGDVCQIVVNKGSVDFSKILPDDADELSRLGANLSSAVASGACQLGAESTQLACSVISAAASKIKDAIVKGDNDWANCLGTTQLGECIGTLYGGIGTITNNSPVEQAQVGRTEDGASFDYKACCLCDLREFEAGVLADSVIGTYTYLSPIQGGDFATGNCAYLENQGKFRPVNSRYLRQYSNCQRRYVAGKYCAADQTGRALVWYPDDQTYKYVVGVRSSL